MARGLCCHGLKSLFEDKNLMYILYSSIVDTLT